MALEVPQLGRSLFGYKRSAVDQLIMEREELFVTAARESGELSLRLDDATGEIATLRGRLTELTDEAAADRARSVDLEQQLHDSRAHVAELDEQRNELERRVTEQTGLLRSSEGRLAVLQAELDSQKSMTVLANERAVRAEATAAERAEQIADLRGRVDHSENEARAADQRAEAARRAVRDVETQVTEAKLELDRLRPELVRTRRELDRVAQESHEARAALEQAQVNRPDDEIPSRDDVVAVFDVAERAMDRIVVEHRRHTAEELELLERRRDGVQQEMERLGQQISRMQAARSRVDGAVSETRIRIDGLAEAFRTALEPVLGSLSALQDGMAELVQPREASEGVDDPSALSAAGTDDDLAAIETDLLCWRLPQELQHR